MTPYETQTLPMGLRAIATERPDAVAVNILTHSAEALEKMAQEITRLRAEREELYVEAWVNASMEDAATDLPEQELRQEFEAEAHRRWADREATP